MDKVGAIAAYCDIGSKYAAITPTIYYILCISWIIKRLFILAYTFTPVRHTDFLTDNKNRPKAPPPQKKNKCGICYVGWSCGSISIAAEPSGSTLAPFWALYVWLEHPFAFRNFAAGRNPGKP